MHRWRHCLVTSVPGFDPGRVETFHFFLGLQLGGIVGQKVKHFSLLQNMHRLIFKSLRNEFGMQALLIIMTRSSDGDVKPGDPFLLFDKCRLMPEPGISLTHPRRIFINNKLRHNTNVHTDSHS